MPNVVTPDFDSTEFAWKDIEITWMGRVLIRVLEVSYSIDAEHKHLYGRGNTPVGIGTGNEKPTGSFTIGQSELEAAIRNVAAAGAKITNIKTDLNIAFLSSDGVVRDRVVGMKITQLPKSMKQGDTDMTVKLPFMALRIDHNV